MKEQLANRAVFDILRRAPLTEAEASLYRRPIADLIRQGIAQRREDGGVELANTTAYATGPAPDVSKPGSIPPPGGVPMPTISVRISLDDMAFINRCETELHMSRADAIRTILERARLQGDRFFGSAQRRKAGS